MPVLGAPSVASSGQTKRGVYLPTGSLDVWKAARDNSANARTEVVIFGDSTTAGSATTVPANYSGSSYTWVQKLRELSIAAGYPDGGRGIAGLPDTAGMSGPDNIPIIQSMNPAGSWVGAGDGNDVLLTDTPTSTTNGATIVFQGHGTAARLHYTKMGSNTGTFTYSVDGGAPVTVDASVGAPTGFSADTIYLPLGGTDTTLHTVMIVNTGAAQRTGVSAEFLKTNGVVYHKHGISGISSNSYFGRANPNNGNYQIQVAYGITVGTPDGNGTYGWQQPVASRPAHRHPSLGIFALGINDMQGLSIGTDGNPTVAEQDAINRGCAYLEDNIGNFVRFTRAAGADPLVVVPHYDMAQWTHTVAGQFARSSWAAGMAMGCAVVDFNEAIRPTNTMVARGLGDPAVHASWQTYDAEAAFLWNNALSL